MKKDPLTIAMIVVLFIAAFMLGGLIIMLLWNIAVVGMVTACGGSISHIGYWTALWGNLLWIAFQNSFGNGLVRK